jgi:asparagine synthase (glutamine-hydrolysing)
MVYFTLAISAGSALQCAALAERARSADPRVMPIPGPATVAWKSPDGRVAVLHWGAAGQAPVTAPRSRAGTIWVDPSDGLGAPLRARTSLTRVDPVYTAEVPDAVILSDRAMWVAAVAGRLTSYDPLHPGALLAGPGFPIGAATPFIGIRALDGGISAEVRACKLVLGLDAGPGPAAGDATGGIPGAGGAVSGGSVPGSAEVAAALVAAVSPLRSLTEPVELSLTGGKDSRLVVAALVAAGVPVRAKTHGFAAHPDVTVATEIARHLRIEHVVREPASPEAKIDVVTRIRSTVLVADGMLSAFENVGRPDHSPSSVVTAGGHGGELLRGGYAETAGAGQPGAGTISTVKRAARATELLRRLTARHVALLRPAPAARYLASLTPWSGAALAHGPLQALDDFYLVNRAGRWSAAARQAYLLRENLVQPLFDDGVVRAARQVPLAGRVRGALPAAVLRELRPDLAEIPYAGKPAKGAVPSTFDWRRQYGDQVARFLRDYTMDLGSTSSLFDVVSQAAAEKALALPQADRATVWALATMACLTSGDYRNARAEAPFLSVE